MNPKKIENLERAFSRLKEFSAVEKPGLSDETAVIKAFEYTFELIWKAFKSASEKRGAQIGSPKSAISAAYAENWIKEEEIWLQILKDRNDSVHSYNESVATDIAGRIRTQYVSVFREVIEVLRKL